MLLYKITYEDRRGNMKSLYVASDREASKARKLIRKDNGTILLTTEVNVPTLKKQLIAWLNIHAT